MHRRAVFTVFVSVFGIADGVRTQDAPAPALQDHEADHPFFPTIARTPLGFGKPADVESGYVATLLAWSPDGSTLAAGYARGRVRLFDANGAAGELLEGTVAWITPGELGPEFWIDDGARIRRFHAPSGRYWDAGQSLSAGRGPADDPGFMRFRLGPGRVLLRVKDGWQIERYGSDTVLQWPASILLQGDVTPAMREERECVLAVETLGTRTHRLVVRTLEGERVEVLDGDAGRCAVLPGSAERFVIDFDGALQLRSTAFGLPLLGRRELDRSLFYVMPLRDDLVWTLDRYGESSITWLPSMEHEAVPMIPGPPVLRPSPTGDRFAIVHDGELWIRRTPPRRTAAPADGEAADGPIDKPTGESGTGRGG